MRFAGILTLLFALAIGCVHSEIPGHAQPLEVMTFNLRYASTEAPNAWSARRPVVRELLQHEAPDLIGTQEGLYSQLMDIEADLPGYAWIGLGRDGGSHGEFMAVFYRQERLMPIEYDHFWLSDTPDRIGSHSWGNKYNRMVTWVRFRDRSSGCEFYAVNTHFDHQVQVAREKSARLLLAQVKDLRPQLPVLLLGDFNAAAGENPVYDRLTAAGAFADTWKAVHESEPEFGTFHDFKGLAGAKESRRIDWILSRGTVGVQSVRIVTFERDGQYPSDHFPVVAQVTPACMKSQ
jgi:endonuclease/exonuclease/phosphatase family metal-dependent hydrolase